MNELPIACTLCPDKMRGRLADLDAVAREALIDKTPIDCGLRHRFRAHPDIEREIRRLAAAEAECSAFLTSTVTTEPSVLLLDITGSPDAQPVIDEFFVAA
jgi:hypothetical protein